MGKKRSAFSTKSNDELIDFANTVRYQLNGLWAERLPKKQKGPNSRELGLLWMTTALGPATGPELNYIRLDVTRHLCSTNNAFRLS
jgi:hypothetical protein